MAKIKLSQSDREQIRILNELLLQAVSAMDVNKISEIKAEIDAISLKEKRKTKYNNKKVEYNGEMYDSEIEADYARFLDNQGIKYIRQLSIPLFYGKKVHGETIKMIKYKLDFFIEEKKIIVDVKGKETPVFMLKWKILKLMHGEEFIYLLPKARKHFHEILKYF